VEEFFHDVPPFSKRYFRGTPKAPAQRDFLAGMPAAPQVSANDVTFLFLPIVALQKNKKQIENRTEK